MCATEPVHVVPFPLSGVDTSELKIRLMELRMAGRSDSEEYARLEREIRRRERLK